MRPEPVRRILLMVDYCHTGESLHLASHVRAVRNHYPEARITLLANEGTRDALASLGVFDRIVVSHLYYDRPLRRFGPRVGKAWEFARLVTALGLGYHLVICFYWGTGLLRLLALAVGRGERVGHAARPTRLLTTRLDEFQRFDRTYAEQHRELLASLGIPSEAEAEPEINRTEHDDRVMAALLVGRGLARADRLAVLHPGSDWACQQWLPERWAATADLLSERHELDIVFTGAATEVAYVEAIRRLMKRPSTTIAGETSLAGVGALLVNAKICVCVDSAIFDLALAHGTPTVVLSGPTKPQLPRHLRQATTQVVRRMDDVRAGDINACRGVHFIDGGCLNYGCSLAGLREIGVEDVSAAVERVLVERGLSGARVEQGGRTFYSAVAGSSATLG